MSLSTQLDRWQKAALIDKTIAEKITAYEKQRNESHTSFGLYGIGSFLVVLGFLAVIAANWDHITGHMKLIGHLAINLASIGAIVFAVQKNNNALKEIMLFIASGLTLTFIALIGQIYQSNTPTWQALTLWLTLTTPALLLFSRARFTIICWLLATQTTFFMYLSDHFSYFRNDTALFLVFLDALTLIAAGEILLSRASESFTIWGNVLRTSGKAFMLVLTSMSIALFSHRLISSPLSEPMILILLLCAAFLFGLRWTHILPSRSKIEDSLEGVSIFCVGLSALAQPSMKSSFLAFLIFMMYWLYIFGLGHKIHERGLAKLALFVLSIRILIAYFELFGSLLQTGTGMILSGLLLIGFVSVAKQYAPAILPEEKRNTP